ncbi:DUF983 domain-containing protein [Paracoccus aminovorans]|uniref:DUF983 domain-containing protein n=1 Tax=Paracoccus aminovorans TaxID=34004 RepID=UPI000785A1DE|nr:DUF983 domain-containing protein [Paracoccus aminovorans]MDQ7777588.1 DUF983 domain-containing protein [Paracoccus aminovorans]
MTSSTLLAQDPGNLKPALRRGACLKCPRCGEGKLFRGYLKVAAQCDACGLDLTPQRADDGPAYVVILLVAHLIGFALVPMFSLLGDHPARIALLLGLAAVALSLALLPPVKGMFVALQWVKGMHGFEPVRAAVPVRAA